MFRTRWLAVLLLCAMPVSALAEFYARFGLGAARATARGDYLGSESTTRLRDTDTALAGGLGWQFNRWASLEATGLASDVFALDDALERDVSGSGYGVSVIGHVPLSPRWSLTGRYGIWRWDMDIKPSLHHGTDNFTGEDRVVGAGIEFLASPQAALHLNYDDYAVEDIDLRTLTLGVRFLFGPRTQPARSSARE